MYSQDPWKIPLKEFNFYKVSDQKPSNLKILNSFTNIFHLFLVQMENSYFVEILPVPTSATDRRSDWKSSREMFLKIAVLHSTKLSVRWKSLKNTRWKFIFIKVVRILPSVQICRRKLKSNIRRIQYFGRRDSKPMVFSFLILTEIGNKCILYIWDQSALLLIYFFQQLNFCNYANALFVLFF